MIELYGSLSRFFPQSSSVIPMEQQLMVGTYKMIITEMKDNYFVYDSYLVSGVYKKKLSSNRYSTNFEGLKREIDEGFLIPTLGLTEYKDLIENLHKPIYNRNGANK